MADIHARRCTSCFSTRVDVRAPGSRCENSPRGTVRIDSIVGHFPLPLVALSGVCDHEGMLYTVWSRTAHHEGGSKLAGRVLVTTFVLLLHGQYVFTCIH